MRFFAHTEQAEFLRRPNRFLLDCRLGRRTVRAYLPNPGRLWEILLPGCIVYLVKHPATQPGKTGYTAVGAEKDGIPILLHTHLTNRVARNLIERNLVPGLENARVVRPEVTVGRSRFDFLLSKGGRDILLEVKSCTLFSERIAMFPDAVTLRGARHLRELASLKEKDTDPAALFVVHSPSADYFMPDFHTDPYFTEALLSARNKVQIRAVAVGWDRTLSWDGTARQLSIPWDLICRESRDSGSYMVILHLKESRSIRIGSLGKIPLRKGYYIYAGSGRTGLAGRIARHQRRRKNLFWHIDYLREYADFVAALPVRSSTDLECEIAGSLLRIAEWHVPAFGSSDCSCPSHLFGMTGNPFLRESFIRTILYFRIDRLAGLLSGSTGQSRASHYNIASGNQQEVK